MSFTSVPQEIDPLTLLPNRATLLARLDDEIARVERYGVPLSLVLLDVRDFDAIRHARGDRAADAVLCRTALALLTLGRDGDLAARVGGDTFALLLPGADEAEARRCAGRIMRAVHEIDMNDEANGAPLHVALGLGTATYDSGSVASLPASLMLHAEEALCAPQHDDDPQA